MERFWKWLMRANARAVFMVSAVALLLALGWWVRDEVRPRPVPSLMPAATAGVSPSRTSDMRLEVLDYVEAQLALDPSLIPETPFRPIREGRRRRRVVASDMPEMEGPDPGAVEEGGLPVGPIGRFLRTPRGRPSGEPETGPVVARLVYRGLFTRSDGSRLALIEDESTNRRSFHPIGTTLHGLHLEAAGPGGAVAKQANGEALHMPIGEQVSISEGLSIDE